MTKTLTQTHEERYREDEIITCLERIGILDHDPLSCQICLHFGNWDAIGQDVQAWFKRHWETRKKNGSAVLEQQGAVYGKA